jgi:hypothetical protein
MTDSVATVAGNPIISARVYVPGSGPWFADVDFADTPSVSGDVTIQVGALALRGTVQASRSGTHALQRRVTIVAGAGGWGSLLSAKGYHADNGVRAQVVAFDAARAAGETIGAFAPEAVAVGADYVRQAGPASRVLEDVIGSATWWVDYEGVTQVGTRSSANALDSAYQVIDFDPRLRLCEFASDDLTAVGIGSILANGLDAPQTVRELELRIDPGQTRVLAWCGTTSSRGRLQAALRSIIDRATDGEIYGPRKYRVVRVSGAGDRVELQPVNRRIGLPDIIPASMWPGASGIHATMTPGAEVLVEFIDGDRTQPIVTHFAPKGGPGFVPVRIDFGQDPTSFIALADLVATELQAFRTWANAHTHSGVTTGGGSSGTATPKGAVGSVASTLVRST